MSKIGSKKASYNTFDAPKEVHPQDKANYLTWLSFDWVVPFLRLGNERQLAPEDMWPLQDSNRVSRLAAEFNDVYQRHNKGILTSFFVIYWAKFTLLGFMQFFTVVCDLYGPGYVLGEIIATVESPALDTTYVLQLVGSLYLSQLVNGFVKSHMNYINDIVGIQFSSSLRSMLFEKAVRLSAKSKKEKTAGDIANLFSIDVINVMVFALSIHQIWIVPCQIAFVLYLLYKIVGWSVFVGLAVVIVTLIVNAVLGVLMGNEEERLFMLKDNRMKVINEVFGAIQIVKFNAWEEKFLAKIRELRQIELGSIGRFFRLLIFLITFMTSTPVLVTLAIFTAFTVLMHRTLTVTIVFSTLALFKSLQDALINLPDVVTSMVQSLVSAKRINDVLLLEEFDPSNVATGTDPIAATYANERIIIAVDNGSFAWEHDTPLFENTNLRIKKDELVVVHGAVGQGKSSLCSILLGEMEKLSGTVFVGGQVAYFSQQAWIQNTTIRENILFGKPYDRIKYQKILDACALQSDLQTFPAGDRTEIGQKGINLSGGQKARISLARACYSDADIYILDSPLSAVDAIVASEIFSKCILGLLRNKTVLLVTHNPEIIESTQVDRTILVQNGKLIESTNDLPRTLQETLITPLRAHKPYWENTNEVIPEYAPVPRYEMLVTPTARSPYKAHEILFTPRHESIDGRLIVEEERAVGRVSKKVVVAYFRAMGGICTFLLVAIATFAMQALKVGSDVWLSYWSNESEQESPEAFKKTSNLYLAIYAVLALGSCVMDTVQNSSVLFFALGASQRMFDAMLRNLLEAPMQFFDTNPIGRILNRFGDDVSSCDLGIPFSLGPILYELSSALFTIGTTLVLTQWFGVLVIPLLYVYYQYGTFFLEPLREVNRIWKTTRSPLISLVSEGIDGSVTIRAYGDKQLRRFYRLHHQKIETFCECRFAYSCINQWFSIRIQLISNTIVGLILVSIVFLHDSLSPGIVGLLITYGLSIPGNLAYMVNTWSRLETSMISPERLHEYMNIQKEGERIVVPEPKLWPSSGKVEFEDVSFRYKPNDPLVLKNVNFSVKDGEKIGIVGRTGAGKSSLMTALFRMNSVASGRILIDNVDITTIGLKNLRSHLAIIPQNPVLFKGTLRTYLDPFEEYEDDQLWSALRKVKMVERVSAVDEKLYGPVEENGENFSVGERQMLCMARALLRQAKIIVLDEATAAIDYDTDKLLQRVIREEFLTSTVLTIAHRLDTVLDCDRIMVFDKGTLVQCDTPKALVSEGQGIFFELVTEGGYMDKMTI
ncbi:multidrug resistance-associated protein 1 [Thraustotheca clavata]|uniref:Multidrug resistance-associated protein 1 n=1 Tax=Thraustotheca clavata TaxID=74557 RepID=A0A1V9YW26_9STRA|nr:multidrug resistance-associated protein 1 [Thraustotheca clavata]